MAAQEETDLYAQDSLERLAFDVRRQGLLVGARHGGLIRIAETTDSKGRTSTVVPGWGAEAKLR